MKKWILGSMLALSLGGLSACGSVCEDALDKLKTCWSSVDCTKKPANEVALCNSTKASVQASQADPACQGTSKARSDVINGCTLDPNKNCDCQ